MLLALIALACDSPAESPGAVVVVADTMRADFGGSDYMPLDLSSCRVYSNAHSASPYTTASTASIVSGRLPTGREKERPGVVGAWPDDAWPDVVLTDQTVVQMMRGEVSGGQWNARHVPGSPAIADEAIAAIVGSADLYVHMTGPHAPIHGGLASATGSANSRSRTTTDQHIAALFRGDPVPDGIEGAARWGYQSAVEHSLASTARIQAATGPDRLFIFTSDHGEAMGEDGLWGHSKSLHDPQIHVPLVVCGPGVVPGEDSTPVGPLCVAETVTGRGPCDLRTGEGLRAGTAGMLVDGEWVTRDVGAEWAGLVDGGSAG